MPEADLEVSAMERLRRLGRALRFVWDSSPGWTVASSGLILVQGLLPLLSLYLLKLALDAVTAGLQAADVSTAYYPVALYVGLMGAVSMATALTQALGVLVSEAQAQIVAQHMFGIIHAKSLEVDLDYYENPEYFDTLHRAQQEAAHRPTRILNGLLQVCRSGVSVVGIAVLLFAFHWMVGALLVLAVLPGVALRLSYSEELYRWNRERTASERQANYFDWLMTSPFPAKEVRLFGLGSFLRQRFNELRERLIRERLRMANRRFKWEAATQVGVALAMFGSYGYIAYRALQTTITIGDVAMYFQAVQRAQAFLREFMTGLAALYEDSLFMAGLDEFLAVKPTVAAPPDPRPIRRPLQTGFVLQNVSFRYPSSSRWALQDIDLSIGVGEMAALVGENGSGKTTLVKLLCRLYDCTSGRIMLDGVDLRDYDPVELRRIISVVFQEYGRYQLRANENIWLGDVSHPLDPQLIESAARMSGAHDVISRLPHGYDTYLGKWFEDGEDISVGEWQKVALARAYLRGGEILVLDEPTSALDAKAEQAVFTHLRELTRDRSSIVISHRFSTVRMADRIHVLERGRIVESGSHDELIQAQDRYAHMFEIQARLYR